MGVSGEKVRGNGWDGRRYEGLVVIQVVEKMCFTRKGVGGFVCLGDVVPEIGVRVTEWAVSVNIEVVLV